MSDRVQVRYTETGLTLTARKRSESGPDVDESVPLLRCVFCAALVEGNWENENYQHTVWHETIGQ